MILITGASRGIGKYLMRYFIDEGMEVRGTYNNSVPDDINLELMSCIDISNSTHVKEWVANVTTGAKKVVLINCAGINYNAFAHKSLIEKWQKVIEINLMGSFNVISAVLPVMRESGFGRIINLSSVVAQKGIPGTSSYSASKSGLWGMTKSIAAENAVKGITINNLNLGYFNIGMIKDVPENYLSSIISDIPKGELGDPKNIIKAVEFLIESDYTTGTSIDINGGLF